MTFRFADAFIYSSFSFSITGGGEYSEEVNKWAWTGFFPSRQKAGALSPGNSQWVAIVFQRQTGMRMLF